MESYAQVLNIAIPFFIILILIEWVWGYRKGMVTNRSLDTVSSLSSGLTNTIKDVIGLSVVIISYDWLVDHLAIYRIESQIWMYVAAFIGLDFAGYWGHRWSHEINLFWNRHIIHHSSEEFNLACALRQSISSIVNVFFFLYIPMALVGVPTQVVAIVAPLHLFAQFWYHTRLIGKMGFLEYILVTPSHHRVHHAINPEYLDKNYAQIFIFWDKWFGTFQEELPEVTPVYGVKRPVNTWNPILINFQHLWLLIQDAWRTNNLLDKIRIWFMPTGWRPEDVSKKFPKSYIDNPYDQVKYDTPATTYLKIWSWVQMLVCLVLMLYLFNNIARFSLLEILLYGVFLFISIFSFTSLMDGTRYAVLAEFFRLIFGFSLIYIQKGWYGLDNFMPHGTTVLIIYLIFSFAASIYFEKKEGPVIRSHRAGLFSLA
ncbi:MAG TPA: sterol desaturase family protein [Saprospiraceae bacterium]|nr:sterol desaturase family protein [Saprospiraceae bacterium]